VCLPQRCYIIPLCLLALGSSPSSKAAAGNVAGGPTGWPHAPLAGRRKKNRRISGGITVKVISRKSLLYEMIFA
jgi:hypothetical protein